MVPKHVKFESATINLKCKDRLFTILESARLNVPFYKFPYDRALRTIPTVGKSVIKSDYGNFINMQVDQTGGLAESLSMSNVQFQVNTIEATVRDGILAERTSGSTGIPFICIKTQYERFALARGIWAKRNEIDHEVSPDNLYMFCHFGSRRIAYDIHDLNINNLRALYDEIDKGRYRWIHAPPSVLLRHIDCLLKHEIYLSLPYLKYIESTGQYLNDAGLNKLSSYFGVEVLNQYGMMETWSIAYAKKNNIFSVLESNVVVEILDDSNEPVSELGMEGRLVVTSLHLKLMPVIRYETGNYGRFIERSEKFIGAVSIFEMLEGRDAEIIKGIDEKVFGNRFFARLLSGISEEVKITDIRDVSVEQIALTVLQVRYSNIEKRNEFEVAFVERLSKSILACFQVEFICTEVYQKRNKNFLFCCRI